MQSFSCTPIFRYWGPCWYHTTQSTTCDWYLDNLLEKGDSFAHLETTTKKMVLEAKSNDPRSIWHVRVVRLLFSNTFECVYVCERDRAQPEVGVNERHFALDQSYNIHIWMWGWLWKMVEGQRHCLVFKVVRLGNLDSSWMDIPSDALNVSINPTRFAILILIGILLICTYINSQKLLNWITLDKSWMFHWWFFYDGRILHN